MPPKFRITRATAQPKVTIYSSPADLLDPAAAAINDEVAPSSDRASQLSVGPHGVETRMLSAVGDDDGLAPSGQLGGGTTPDLEDLIRLPSIAAPSTPSSVTVATPVTPGGSNSYTSLRRTTRSATRPVAVSAERVKVEVKHEEPLAAVTVTEPPVTPTRPRKRAKREPVTPADQTIKAEDGQATPGSQPRSAKKAMPLPKLEKPHPAPARWEEQYRLIERMRKGIVAPVDDMGCERPQLGNTTPKMQRFHVLISLMLSSQTKDAITSQAVTNLHITLPDGLSAESLAAASAEVVSGCINKVGFWRRKTEYIQDAAKLCLEEHDGDVPNTIEGLCAIRGVGPKMAYLALQCAWEINAGIGVDVHVHRITNRLKWHKPPTQTPEQTRVNLESWLPSHLHRAINPLLVGFGQVICVPVGPRCDLCLLGQAKICPSRVANVKAEGRKEVVYTFTADGDNGVKFEQASAKVEVGYEVSTTLREGEPEGTPLVAVHELTRSVEVKQELP